MNAEFIEALNAIEKERGISKDILIDAFESALIAAYKRNYGAVGNVRATVDRDTGEVQIFASKTVTETVENPYAEISLAEAKKINSLYEVGVKAFFGKIRVSFFKKYGKIGVTIPQEESL